MVFVIFRRLVTPLVSVLVELVIFIPLLYCNQVAVAIAVAVTLALNSVT